MKRKLLFTILISFFTCAVLLAQGAKKPRIMVVPSDALLLKKQLIEATDDMGELNFYQYYNLAFLDDEIKAVISKFGEMMKERGFPITILEFELKKVQNNPDYVIPRDIDIMLNYELRQRGPRQELYVEFQGLDVCSSKQIAGASGQSAPAIGAMPQGLLQEAVIDKIDYFNNQLMSTFEEMMEKGREASLFISSTSVDLEDGDPTLAEWLEEWLANNCVRGSFSIDNIDGSSFQASQVMMPLFGENGRAVDARTFFRPLVKALKDRGLSAKFRNRGIGTGIIIIE